MAVNISVLVFWIIIPSSGDGGSKFLRDDGIHPQGYTVLHIIRPHSE
jgi:hypothetical protein